MTPIKLNREKQMINKIKYTASKNNIFFRHIVFPMLRYNVIEIDVLVAVKVKL